ncbi:MAG: DUF4340 domain-containing protein [Candidatus Eisenbacteria bacterium]|uniref:DUF4340 domain-containing protein n=1 Tax=Eiseniibacteriota bacterium TaxID=2212470 RepID=A0A948WEX6_UNCEI|nr:DUF4340 domain-containing protein [Candidatus Eisenbacteria bacterium]MBU1948966.1 DUF4340 domain-containing protein [Candidatus Eisenbacteria bacterium]MBU2693173.1 DUF4340 domain-containing protein [Candidatus Eisenbacteria bacterium]
MRSRIWIQILLAGGILLLWYYIAHHPNNLLPEPGPFDSIEPDSVRSLIWIGDDGLRLIERSGEEWIYRCGSTSRPAWRTDLANERFVKQMLQELNRFRAKRILTPDEESDLFGLNRPLAGLVIQATAVAETLWIGNRTPVAGGCYAYWSGLGGSAAVLDAYIVEQYVMSRDDQLREPKLGRIPLGKIEHAEIIQGERRFRLTFLEHAWWIEKRAGSQWTQSSRADSLLCQKAVGTLQRMRAIHFLNGPGELEPADLDLDPPLAQWILTAGSKIDTFRIGRHLASEGRLAVWVNQRPPAWLQEESWAVFSMPAASFRYRSLFGTDEKTWVEIEVRRPGGEPIHFRRIEEMWVLEKGELNLSAPDPKRILSTAIANLSRLRFASFAEPERIKADDLTSDRTPDLIFIVTQADGSKESLRVWNVSSDENPNESIVEGSHQPGIFGSVPSTEFAIWNLLNRKKN